MSRGAVRIELLPLGKTLAVEHGTPLQDALFAQGVEFPCGGRGRCKGCRVKVLSGALAPTVEDERLLSRGDLADGWRLACRARAEEDLKIELAQWEATILADESKFEFISQDGLGVVVDLGTTTLVAQLLDLRSGHVLAVRTALNPQAKYGADIMSRIDFAVTHGGQELLTRLIRKELGRMIGELLSAAHKPGRGVEGRTPVPEPYLKHVVIVGNTVMHQLFCGLSVEPLGHFPFEPEEGGLQLFKAADLKWPRDCVIRFLPCLGSFVGSDILAGILATCLHESDAPAALIDLGTNGEIVVGNREQMLCASTAAGPAFEGARISMGMRAATGAISEVVAIDNQLRCRVLGNVAPRGLCGSGLVDAVAAGLDLSLITPNGRLANGGPLPLAMPVSLSQGDIRELQLAKGAIAAGLRILTQQWGTTLDGLKSVYLAGAFGNYVNRASARRIGLLHFPAERVTPAGNTALLGAKLALFSLHEHDASYPELRRRVQHVSLNEDTAFHDIYVGEMTFPSSA